MLEIKFIRQNLAAVEAGLAARGQRVALETFKAVDGQHRKSLQEIEDLRHRRNVVSDEIARLKKAGDPAEALVLEMRSVSARIKELEKAVADTQEGLSAILMGLPNLPHASVPLGRDSSENPVIKT
ncbi:MAG TPA: serine--tRNA ligase, partial [Desulfobacterales bacterium]|nr:serine--tRNA ligase [Desulfobacterales bacterium]